MLDELRVSMISLGVTDMARSLEFYTGTLGLATAGGAGEVMLLKAGGVTLVLNRPLARASEGAIVGATEVIFGVASVAATHAELRTRGCIFIREPREIAAGMWSATFTDPDGHRLTLFGPE